MTDPNAPAYPSVHSNLDADGHGHGPDFGLTKRECFAAMAMQGLISNPSRDGGHKTFAMDSVAFTDTLIEALNADK